MMYINDQNHVQLLVYLLQQLMQHPLGTGVAVAGSELKGSTICLGGVQQQHHCDRQCSAECEATVWPTRP
jgi:hypothetical protein